MHAVYEIHKVVNEATHQHEPMLISRDAGETYEPMTLSGKQVDELFRIAIAKEARPCVRYDDGRVQTGHYVFVPQETKKE
jgi:hypothetical protein